MKKLLFIIPVLISVACQKEITNNIENGEPVFHTTYTIDGQTVTLNAGDNDKYMFSGIDKDSLSVDEYYGDLTNINNPRTNALQFIFRNAVPFGSDVDSTFRTGQKELLSNFCGVPVSTMFQVKFKPWTNGAFNYNNWVINSTITTTLDEPIYTFDTNEVTSIPVYLHTYYNNGCIASSSRCLDFRNLGCSGDFEYSHLFGYTYQFSLPTALLGQVEKVIWYIGSSTYEGNTISHTFQNGLQQSMVHASIVFKSGCESCVGKKLSFNQTGGLIQCENDIDFEITEFTNYDHLQLGKIEVNYWDDNGIMYSSKWGPDPGIADIVSVEDYKVNKDGLPTKKVHLKGTFTLTSLSGKELTLENVNAIIAVAYQ